MILLRQGRVIPSAAPLQGQSVLQLVRPWNNALPLLSIRDALLRPGIRQSQFTGQSVSRFSTLNSRACLQQKHSILAPTRPTLALPKARLAASLSTAAQRMLEESTQENLASDIATEGIHRMGDFAQMGLGTSWWPSDLMIRLLEFCHVSTGLPWWASIALVTLMLRVALFPVMLKSTRNIAVVPYIAERQKVLLEETKRARESNELVQMRQVTMKLTDLYREWGYSPLINILGFVQVPIFFGMFRTCTRCSNLPVPGWQEGGALWFTDLTAIDPYFILPTISGVTTAVTIWMGQKDTLQEPKGALGFFVATAPVLSIALIPLLGAYQPASVFVYWTMNNFILLGQYMIFNNPRSRAFLGVLPVFHKGRWGGPPRPGFKGFILDRMDYIKLAFKNYIADADARRARINQIGKGGAIKYETKAKEPADRRAREAGAVEKLK